MLHRRILPAMSPLLAAATLLAAAPLAAQSLRGSKSSINRMYEHAVDADLHFYRTGGGIRNAAAEGRFVRLRSNRNYALAGVTYPYVRPTTRTFLDRLSSQYRSACGERLVVTSAARPQSMRLFNSARRTVHPTGIAVDVRKSSRRRCRDWLRETLLVLERQGVLEATEEHRPPHFHIAVFPAPYGQYVAERGGRPDVTATRTAARAPSARGGAKSSSKPTRSKTAATRYRVRKGDSLWAIARRHSVTVARLKSVNGLRSSTVKPGQTLLIPKSGR